MQTLFDAVRNACSATTWSRGVELARAGAVSGERSDPDEVVLRVATRGGLIAPAVSLYPDDVDWECECSSAEAACPHVAAAAIALKQARAQGFELPAPTKPAGTIRYLLRRCGGELEIEREIVTDEGVHPLKSSLHALAVGRVEGPAFVARSSDLEIERVLGPRQRGVLPPGLVAPILDALAACSDVRLDGEAVRISRERVRPRARLREVPGGFELRLEADAAVHQIVVPGVVRSDDTLRVLGQSRLTGRELEDLPRGRFFSHEQVTELATDVLPSLRERIDVEIDTKALPEATRIPPRILLQVDRTGDRLSVLPTLVYGDPPSARVDAGRLVHLGGPIPMRDESAERQRAQHLQRALGLAPGHRVEFAGAEAVELSERLGRWPGEIRGDAHQAFFWAPALEPRLDLGDSTFAIEFVSTGDADRSGHADAEHVLRAWREGASEVALVGGGLAPLPDDWLQRFGHRVADLLAARDDDGTLPTCALPALGTLCDDLDHPRPARLEALAPLLAADAHIPRAQRPGDLCAELRPYQEDGADWLCFLRDHQLGALLADDMGLGKTLQALCAIGTRTLVVAPTSVLHNWASEAARFRPELSVSLYHGPTRRFDDGADVTLTSYALLRIDADALCEREWDAVILDEAQNIKNPESQVAQAAYRLRARFRIALTGTPVENRLDELWSQFHFLNRGLLGGRRDFRDRSARPIADGDETALTRLRARLGPFLMRRLKREVAPELPPRSEVVLHCALSESEREVYDAVRAATVANAVQKLRTGGGVMAALEALLRLRQAACHSALVPGQEADSSSKLELLIDRCVEAAAEGHRALIFSQWTSLLDLLEPGLRSANLEFTRLDGTTRDRGGVVARFQDESGPPLMLASLKAGGTGLNLTAADHVFLLDPWWNPAVEDQAADRAHRIGQQRPVVIHRLVAADTVEERILELQAGKRAIAEAALSGADPAAALGRDELLTLLEA